MTDVVSALFLIAPLAVTMGGSQFVRLHPDTAHRTVVWSFAAQSGLLLIAITLLTLLPRKGNRSGGTCASFRRGSLDEIVVAFGWLSAVIGAVGFAGAIIASRHRGHTRWLVAAASAVVLPYAIFVAYYWTGLCYALDT